LSAFFFFDFFLLAMAAILVRVNLKAVGTARAPDRENSIAQSGTARKWKNGKSCYISVT